MDLAVLIIGFIMGFVAAYFTVGPGKDKMNKKNKETRPAARPRTRTVKQPRKAGTVRGPSED